MEDSEAVAGDSTTPLFRKLGVREGMSVAVVGAPDGVLPRIPAGIHLTADAEGPADVVWAFFTTRSAFEQHLDELASRVFPAGALWISWPKRSSGVATDMSDSVVRDAALPLGLVDNKVCAVDGTWTALRVVWRTERRAGPPPSPSSRVGGSPRRNGAPPE